MRAIEPTPDEVRAHAVLLARAYNEPRNATRLGHSAPLLEDDVVAHYGGLFATRGHGFLMFRDDVLVGDADLRGVAGGAGEFAFLIADVAAQGKGLGTKLALMVHAFAFEQLALERVYASVLPSNTASLRVFEKLGYVVDDGPAARAYADEPDDVTLVIDRERFERLHRLPLVEIAIAPRSGRRGGTAID